MVEGMRVDRRKGDRGLQPSFVPPNGGGDDIEDLDDGRTKGRTVREGRPAMWSATRRPWRLRHWPTQ